MKTVVLRMLCDSGWLDAAGDFFGKAVLVDLDLDSGRVSAHFENDPGALNPRGPLPACGLLFEPAGLDDGSALILSPAWDFAGKATGFHIACRSLHAHKQELKRWAAWQEGLALVNLRYLGTGPESADRLAA